jgi:hypothetical protein
MEANIKNDPDLIRIKFKIEILNNMFKQGVISIIINYFVNWMVAIEISNGIDKITIQEILLSLKDRINTLNKTFDELEYYINNLDKNDPKYNEKCNTEKEAFKNKVYKLFDLSELLMNIVKKCVTFGFGLARIMPSVTLYIKQISNLLVDTILTTDSDEEFHRKVIEYINERASGIEDPIERKLNKIEMLNKLMKDVIDEPIDFTYYQKKNIDIKDINIRMKLKNMQLQPLIELTEKLHPK